MSDCFSIGWAKCSRNRVGFGNRPGAVIDSIDHSSIRLFSIGVPVMASLNGAGSRRAHWYTLDWWFLANWASSRISPDHCAAAYASASSRNSVYEVTTTSALAMTSTRSWPRRRNVSVIVTTRRSGVNRAASAAQLASTLVGATMRNGSIPGRSCFARQIMASVCNVLPRPMSSARMPPSWLRSRKHSHSKPSRW